MKEPVVLIRADTGEATFFCCGECGAFCGDDKNYAARHCGGQPCDLCGEPCRKNFTRCEACREKSRAEQSAAMIAKAEKLDAEKYDGPVFWDEKDEYYLDVGEAFEAVLDEFIDDFKGAKQQTLWACDKTFLKLVPSNILDQALESQEHHEDAYEAISGKAINELKAFCDTWNTTYGSGVESWLPNKKLIVIPEAWQKEKHNGRERENKKQRRIV